MLTYHFFWDLGYFGYININLIVTGTGLIIAEIIGACFILISGISLRLLNENGKDSNVTYLKRLLKLSLLAALISISSWLLDRDTFIFFGILHFLTFCTILSLVLMKFNNNFFNLITLIIFASFWMSNLKIETNIYLSWFGVSKNIPSSNDFYPVVPWIIFFLTGYIFKFFVKIMTILQKDLLSLKINI